MLARPAFRSFFSLARAVRMSLARLSASILWSSDRSGAASGGLDWGGRHVGGEYSRGSRACKGDEPIAPKFISTSTRGRVRAGSRERSGDRSVRAPRRPASPPAGRGSSRSRPPPAVAPAARNSARVGAAGDPPMPTIGSSTAARDGAQLRQRDRPHRRAGEAAVPGRERRRAAWPDRSRSPSAC